MPWNYRVLAFEDKKSKEVELRIAEVYYVDGACTKPNAYGDANPVSTEGLEGLKWLLDRQKEALEKPILWGDERFPNEYSEKE